MKNCKIKFKKQQIAKGKRQLIKGLNRNYEQCMDIYSMFVSVMSVYHPELQELKINAIDWGKVIDCFIITLLFDRRNDSIIEGYIKTIEEKEEVFGHSSGKSQG